MAACLRLRLIRGVVPGLALASGIALGGCAPAATAPEPGVPGRTAVAAPVATRAAPASAATAGAAVPADTASTPLAGGPLRATAPPTAGSSPPAAPVASLTLAAAAMAPGACVDLAWAVSGARRVRLGGREVEPSGSMAVCPEADTTYYLWFEGLDGRPHERSASLRVAAPERLAAAAGQAGADDDEPAAAAAPTLEPTPCPTECEVLAPTERPRVTRTPRPTSPPEPTAPPAATEPPAEPTAPPATAEPEPTAPPEPSEPPEEPTAPPEPTPGG
jgi:hypothetical protein